MPDRARIVLLGIGAVGRELIGQITGGHGGIFARLRVCGVVDRSGYVFEANGLSRKSLRELCAHKRSGGSLRESPLGHAANPLDAVGYIAARVGPRAILIDVTDADTHEMLEIVLERGWAAVLANKVPLAATQARVDALYAIAGAGGGDILHEATVGAGLPVIDTLRKLLEAGDRILSIEGCPSGTLGLLFGRLDRGERFSDVLRDSIRAGYTEPDPRVDLSGADVARKALILARMLGFRGDLDSVRVESLVPDLLLNVSLEDFLARSCELDEALADRVAAARSRGAVLRYRARVTRRSVSVGLAEVPQDDPLGRLQETDNQFTFTTARYRNRPLVIAGPGAGCAVTAAGVYADLLRVLAERASVRPHRDHRINSERAPHWHHAGDDGHREQQQACRDE